MKPKTELPEKGRATLKDDQVQGLELRGNRKGASWTLRHRVGGKRIRDVIGRWPALSPSAARNAAKAKLAAVAVTSAAGGDVLAQRAEQHRHKHAKTFKEALDIYVDQRSELRTIGHAQKVIEDVFAKLLGDKLPTVTKPAVLACVDARKSKAPAVADLSIRYLRPFLKWSYDRGYVDADLLTLRVGQTKKRDRYLSRAELGKVIVALEDMEDHVGALAVRMMVATAQRRDEVGKMLWTETDGDLWTVPKHRTKTGTDYHVPLNDYALDVLDEARGRAEDSDLVFVGATGRTAFNGWSRFKVKLDKASGVTDWTFHDLRRTFATLSADAGLDPIIADRCLNHVGASTLNDVARRYQHSSLIDRKREAFDQWDRIINEVVATERGQNVVALNNA